MTLSKGWQVCSKGFPEGEGKIVSDKIKINSYLLNYLYLLFLDTYKILYL